MAWKSLALPAKRDERSHDEPTCSQGSSKARKVRDVICESPWQERNTMWGTEQRGAVPPPQHPGAQLDTRRAGSTKLRMQHRPHVPRRRCPPPRHPLGKAPMSQGKRKTHPSIRHPCRSPGAAGIPSSTTLTPRSGWAARLPAAAPEWAQASVKPPHA